MASDNIDRGYIVDQELKYPEHNATLENAFTVDSLGKVINVPKNILGYYIQLIKKIAEDKELGKLDINVSYQEEHIPNNQTPSIYVFKGNLSPVEMNAPGGTFTPIGIDLEPVDGINVNETKTGTFLLEQEMGIKIFGANRAEIEKVSYIIYLALLATTDDVLHEIFPNILRVSQPVMTAIAPVPKQTNYYVTQIVWRISFIESAILFFKEKMLKYTRLIVHENKSKDIIQ